MTYTGVQIVLVGVPYRVLPCFNARIFVIRHSTLDQSLCFITINQDELREMDSEDTKVGLVYI